MSLHVITRADTGTLWITGTVRPAGSPQGVRIRRRAGTDSPSLAREEAAALEVELLRSAWHGERKGTRSFGEAAASYLTHEPRSAATDKYVERLVRHFGEMALAAIDQEAVDKARAVIMRPGPKAATVRRALITPLRAVMVHASRRGWCARPVFDQPAEPKGRTRFLMPAEVHRLIDAASPHMRPIILFLACTGCRVSEALALDWRDVDLPGGRVILWEGETKGGSRRIVELPAEAVRALSARYVAHQPCGRTERGAGRVFLDNTGSGYRDAEDGGGQMKTAWRGACRRAGLTGATPHVLRHSWASWHYAVHRDLLRLKAEGGWTTTRLVERYAHVMPSGHEAAIRQLWHGIDTVARKKPSKTLK